MVLVCSDIKDHQHNEDNDEQKKERKTIENVYEKPIKTIR